ncbi:VOC family protein [Anaeropeptidivorans aminofermentans]|uniref:VOC family protein n=1 Tax=Anaeropeptidivorans aminofermentans TaxID=2934315 RepID=UPI0020255300|nr:VOC family protein [Anaeropeptidivorans aminofermentans]MBE6013189.1 hypothetical protein [Lachnospiraceae bacterium]
MEINPQVYVKGSMEAVKMYCKAFGAEISFEVKNASKDAYIHCELSLDGQLFMAVSEAPDTCDTSKKTSWQTMAFNVSDMRKEETVRKAYDALKEGGTVIDPLGPCDWNSYCANIVDKFGVFWWIAI